MSEEKIGIIGGGLMGTGIAFVVARQIEGKIVVVDVEQKILDKSRRTVEGLAARAVEKGLDAILKCQIIVDGRRTAWCAQHGCPYREHTSV